MESATGNWAFQPVITIPMHYYPPSDSEFVRYIDEIYEATLSSQQFLVIRDWCHLDYMGVPFRKPTYVNHLTQILAQEFLLNSVYIIRHPIDQLLSIIKSIRLVAPLKLEDYLYSYLCYLKAADLDRLIKYEDFVDDPDANLRKMTQMLAIPYDPTWSTKWSDNTKVTGDGRAKGEGSQTIQRKPRSPLAPELLNALAASEHYQQILTLTGYGHPF